MTGPAKMMTFAAAALLATPALAQSSDRRVGVGAAEPKREQAATSEAAREVVLPAIRYQILASGPPDGLHPTRNSAVKVRYEGRLTDGTVFVRTHDRGDGTEIFRLGGLIPGYVAIVQAMRPGDRWQVFIPVAFAYPSGPPAVAGKDLIFDIELIDFADLPPVSGSPLMSALPGKE